MKDVEFKNFRSFGPKLQRLKLKKINLIFGENSSGKSSLVDLLLQSPMFMDSVTVGHSEGVPNILSYNGDRHIQKSSNSDLDIYLCKAYELQLSSTPFLKAAGRFIRSVSPEERAVRIARVAKELTKNTETLSHFQLRVIHAFIQRDYRTLDSIDIVELLRFKGMMKVLTLSWENKALSLEVKVTKETIRELSEPERKKRVTELEDELKSVSLRVVTLEKFSCEFEDIHDKLDMPKYHSSILEALALSAIKDLSNLFESWKKVDPDFFEVREQFQPQASYELELDIFEQMALELNFRYPSKCGVTTLTFMEPEDLALLVSTITRAFEERRHVKRSFNWSRIREKLGQSIEFPLSNWKPTESDSEISVYKSLRGFSEKVAYSQEVTDNLSSLGNFSSPFSPVRILLDVIEFDLYKELLKPSIYHGPLRSIPSLGDTKRYKKPFSLPTLDLVIPPVLLSWWAKFRYARRRILLPRSHGFTSKLHKLTGFVLHRFTDISNTNRASYWPLLLLLRLVTLLRDLIIGQQSLRLVRTGRYRDFSFKAFIEIFTARSKSKDFHSLESDTGSLGFWKDLAVNDTLRERINSAMEGEDRLDLNLRFETEETSSNWYSRTHFLYLTDLASGNFTDKLNSVGTGISQLLPIVGSLVGKENTSIFIKQPELHAHPLLSARIADEFIRSSNERNNQIIAETHSEHILLRLQRRIRDTFKGNIDDELKLTNDDVAILYVSKDEDGVSSVREIELDEDGSLLEPWPDGFFDAGLKERFL